MAGKTAFYLEDLGAPPPGPGQIKVRNCAIGLNFVDVLSALGSTRRRCPLRRGQRGAGEVMSVPDVTDFRPGDRVAYQGPVGAYADIRLLLRRQGRAAARRDRLRDRQGGAAQGATPPTTCCTGPMRPRPARRSSRPRGRGRHGQILTQWAKAIGATVIGTAGSETKCEIVRANGADLAINYRSEDFVARVREFTAGAGVDVVYDGVGQATFEPSLDCLASRGLMVSFGNASGPVSIPRLGIPPTRARSM